MFGFVYDSYSYVIGVLGGPLKEAKKEQIIREKLLHIKEIKKKRDFQLSSRVATLRDRVRTHVPLVLTRHQ